MRPVSDAFLRTITGPHKMVAEARIVAPGQTGTDPEGVTIQILSGDVRLDASADVRSTVDLTTSGVGMWPSSPSDLITPYGPELWVRRGIEYGNGQREWVSLGYHKIYSVEQDEAPDGPIRIAARDRMAGLVDARMLAPVQFNPNHTVRQFFDRLVLEVYPWAVIEYDFLPEAIAVNRTIVVEEDRYAALFDMARSLGRVMYWDHAGKLQIRKPPDVATPAYEVSYGRNGVLVEMSRSLTRDGVYNAVVAQGEAPDDKPPVRAVARDMNPVSPTYWYGPFGQVPRYYSSPFITNTEQAASAAAAMLARSIGLPYSVDFTAVPNPALEPLDRVRIRYRDGSTVHVVQTLTIPLTPSGAMEATTREQTNVAIEIGEDL